MNLYYRRYQIDIQPLNTGFDYVVFDQHSRISHECKEIFLSEEDARQAAEIWIDEKYKKNERDWKCGNSISLESWDIAKD